MGRMPLYDYLYTICNFLVSIRFGKGLQYCAPCGILGIKEKAEYIL